MESASSGFSLASIPDRVELPLEVSYREAAISVRR